jgi:branched-chain amino acid transport system substrate-binding protein
MKKKNIFLIAWIIIIIIALVLVFTINKSEEKDNNTIKIGVMLVLSGEGASWGEASKNGIELALKDFIENNDDTKNINVLYQDTMGTPKGSVDAYNYLINIEKVDAIIGPSFQEELDSILPVVNSNFLPIITPMSTNKGRNNLKNPLLVWITPDYEAGKLAEYVFNQGYKKVAIIGSSDSWGSTISEGFKNNFLESGGEVVYFDLLLDSDIDVSTTVYKAIQKDPEIIFFGTYFLLPKLTKKLNETNYNGRIYSVEIDEYMASELNYLDNLEFISPSGYSSEFNEKYKSEYNSPTSLPVGQAYDSANILFSILKETTNKKEIIEKFSQLKEYDGVSGKIIFTEDGKTLMPLSIYKIVDGEIVKVKNIE